MSSQFDNLPKYLNVLDLLTGVNTKTFCCIFGAIFMIYVMFLLFYLFFITASLPA